MSQNTNAALAASIAGGYLLGRSGKGKLAVALATYVASRKLQAKPQESSDGDQSKPEGSKLSHLSEHVRTDLLSVGREAVKAAVDQRLESFADSLADRTKALGQAPESDEDEAPEEGEEGEQGDTEEESGRSERSARTPKRSRTSGRPRDPAESDSSTGGSGKTRRGSDGTAGAEAEKAPRLNKGAQRAVQAAKHSSAAKSRRR